MLLRLIVALLLCACGAKTGLSVGASDLGARDGGWLDDLGDGGTDADPGVDERPACLEALEPGTVRGELESLASRVVFDRSGNLFGVRSNGEERELVRWNPCLEETWAVPLASAPATHTPFLKVGTAGEIYVTIPGGLATVSASGAVLAPLLPPSRHLVDLIATRPYPIALSGTGLPTVVELRAFPSGRPPIEEVAGVVEGIRPDNGGCLVARDVVSCGHGSLSFRVNDLSTIYTRPVEDPSFGTRLPATDGERLFASGRHDERHELRAHSLATGDLLWVRDLESPFNLDRWAVSAPVYAQGLVFVHHSAGEPDDLTGRLDAFDVGGALRWTHVVPSSPDDGIQSLNRSHLAVGDTGLLYLPTGSELHALTIMGELEWRAPLPANVDAPLLNLSPFGDLALRTAEGSTLIVATDCSGPAIDGWPIASHDPQATNAFEP